MNTTTYDTASSAVSILFILAKCYRKTLKIKRMADCHPFVCQIGLYRSSCQSINAYSTMVANKTSSAITFVLEESYEYWKLTILY